MNRLSLVAAALWSSLFDSAQRPIRYLGRALLVDLPVTLPLGALVTFAAPTKGPDFPRQPLPAMLLGLCVLAPLIETLLMMLLFFILRLVVRQNTHLMMLSPLVWAGLHSCAAPTWGLVVFWPFLIFSICYITWEAKSPRHAFWITASLHALHNLIPATALLASRYS